MKKKSKREVVFAPIFGALDVAFAATTLVLVIAYVCRKYLEYVVTGKWGRTINVKDPSIRRSDYYRRHFDAESYRTQGHTSDTETDTT